MEVATLYRLTDGTYRADVPLDLFPALLELGVDTSEHDGIVSATFDAQTLPRVETVLQGATCHIVHTYDTEESTDVSGRTVDPPEQSNPYDRAKRMARQKSSFMLTGPGGTGRAICCGKLSRRRFARVLK